MSKGVVADNLLSIIRQSIDEWDPRFSPRKTGTITPEILEALQKRGVDVGNIDPKLLATMGLASTAAVGGSLLMPSDAEGSEPTMGWREWPTAKPRGRKDTASDMMIGNPAAAMGGSWGGLDSLLTVLDSPLKAMQGGARLAGGLLAGEGWDDATDAAGGVIKKDTGEVQKDFADWVSKKTGNSELDSLFRVYAEWLPQLMGP